MSEHKTQLEIDFVHWLSELSANVVEKYGRWLETEDGDANGGEFCVDCIDAAQAEAIANNDPYCVIGGWNDSPEQDHQDHCEKCGCQLKCSPTRYMIEEEIAYLATLDEMDADNAASFYNWLSGMGDYQREKDWPLIKPHAVRLMTAASVDVVHDGFIRFHPSDVWNNNWYHFDTVWLSIYQHFAQQLIPWMKGESVYEVLCDTSGIHFTHFEEFSGDQDAHKCVRKLIEHVGQETSRGQFLASIGLKSMADLDRPIVIPDDRADRPTFDVRGRILKGTPNKCHPEAKTVTNAVLQLSSNAKCWQYRMHYDYNHYEHSSWCVSITQKRGQSLADFMVAVGKWQERVLEPVGWDDRFRKQRLDSWDRKRAALNNTFYFDFGNMDGDIALANLLGDKHIKIGKQRLATLKRWIAEDAATERQRPGNYWRQ